MPAPESGDARAKHIQKGAGKMSEGKPSGGVLYIAEEGAIAMMKVQGDGVRNLAEGFDKWIDHLVASTNVGCVIVDLAQCTYMDSTFMGMLVKLARLLMKRCKLLIANARPLHHELLDGIGVMKGWEYVDQPVSSQTWSELCDAISGKLNARLVVEVHQQLIEWDERNKKFIPFVNLALAELNDEKKDADDEEDDD